MKKISLAIVAATTLSACVSGGGAPAVTQNDTLSSSCGITHMQTMNGLPMRCGPQSAAPYTMR